MEFVILIDNLPEEPLVHEHGLSILFKSDEKTYLVDTGASGKFLQNLSTLGLCGAEDIDSVIISHGHNDHTGGLRSLLEANSSAPVYLHKSIRGNLFFSCRPKRETQFKEFRSIGMEQALFVEHEERFREISQPHQLTPKITLIPAEGELPYPTPMGNEFLYKGDYPDNFTHETITLIEDDDKRFVVISPCTHNGILNILERCVEYLSGEKKMKRESATASLKCFIGGLHYVDYLNLPAQYPQRDESGSIISVARKVMELYPNLKIHSGHCTSPDASNLMKKILGESYKNFHTGSKIEAI